MQDNRPQFFVSIAVASAEKPETVADRLRTISGEMDAHFRYWELLLVVDEDAARELETVGHLLAGLRNLRIVVVAAGTGYYQRRYVGAREAIGDVVALVDLCSIQTNALAAEIVRTYDQHDIAIGYHPARMATRPLYYLLSIMSQHRIVAQASRTLLVSRDRLTQILSRASAIMDLRFEPRNGAFAYRRFDVANACGGSRRGSESSFDLGVQLITAAAPRYLKAFAGISVFTALAALLFAVYAVGALIFLPHLQPGWFSSSIIQAGSVGFISIGMTVFSLALAVIYERQSTEDVQVVIRELGNTSFFANSAVTIVEFTSPASRLQG